MILLSTKVKKVKIPITLTILCILIGLISIYTTYFTKTKKVAGSLHNNSYHKSLSQLPDYLVEQFTMFRIQLKETDGSQQLEQIVFSFLDYTIQCYIKNPNTYLDIKPVHLEIETSPLKNDVFTIKSKNAYMREWYLLDTREYRYEYDRNGKLKTVYYTGYPGTSSDGIEMDYGLITRSEYEYDASDNLTKLTQYDKNNSIKGVYTYSYQYDLWKNITEIRETALYGLSKLEQFTYDENQILRNYTKLRYDSNGQLSYSDVWEYNKHGDPTYHMEQYNPYSNGHRMEHTYYYQYNQNDTKVVEYQYDTEHNMQYQKVYDSNSKLIYHYDADVYSPAKTYYIYDNEGKKTTEFYYTDKENIMSLNEFHYYQYDDNNNLIKTIIEDELKLDMRSLYIEYSYDFAGNMTSEALYYNPDYERWKYTYEYEYYYPENND